MVDFQLQCRLEVIKHSRGSCAEVTKISQQDIAFLQEFSVCLPTAAAISWLGDPINVLFETTACGVSALILSPMDLVLRSFNYSKFLAALNANFAHGVSGMAQTVTRC